MTLTSQREAQREATRSRILEAATEAFADGSVLDTPLDRVAELAGVSRPTVLFHFGSRIDLLAAVAEHLYMRGVVHAASRGPDDVRTYLRRYLRAQRRPEVKLIWQIGDVLATQRPDGPNAAYAHIVSEFASRLDGDRSKAVVLASAAMLVARRVALDLADDVEVGRFLDAVDDVIA